MAVLVIAHRLSTISKSNNVYVMHSGKIIEDGPFSVLSNNSGSYLYNLLKIQNSKE